MEQDIIKTMNEIFIKKAIDFLANSKDSFIIVKGGIYKVESKDFTLNNDLLFFEQETHKFVPMPNDLIVIGVNKQIYIVIFTDVILDNKKMIFKVLENVGCDKSKTGQDN